MENKTKEELIKMREAYVAKHIGNYNKPCEYKEDLQKLDKLIATKAWLEERVWEYEQDGHEAIKNMLVTTHNVMLQYKNNPTSKAAKGVFDACIAHNKLFLIKVGIMDND